MNCYTKLRRFIHCKISLLNIMILHEMDKIFSISQVDVTNSLWWSLSHDSSFLEMLLPCKYMWYFYYLFFESSLFDFQTVPHLNSFQPRDWLSFLIHIETEPSLFISLGFQLLCLLFTSDLGKLLCSPWLVICRYLLSAMRLVLVLLLHSYSQVERGNLLTIKTKV